MTIVQMQYFIEVCQYQNISLAAKMLYISQPALSASLAELEEEVGFKLFHRKSKGVYPTEEGLLLLKHAEAVVKRFNLMQREIPRISQNQNLLKVGFRPYGGEHLFFRIYRDFEKMHPEAVLYAHETSNYVPASYLDDDVVDFLVAGNGIMPMNWKERYESQLLGVQEPSLYCHKDHPLASQTHVSFEDFCRYPIVFWDGHSVMMASMGDVLAEYGLKMNVVGVMPQMTGLMNFVYNNIAMAFLAGDFCQDIECFRRIPLPEQEGKKLWVGRSEVHVYWKKDTERYTNKKMFIDYIRSLER
ncbi:MAG: LysR family transcriptional regulator [Lachnospiraceae bacterium]|nr:LysR family transcriptional regulator [Lachnospiraceae bacterium]